MYELLGVTAIVALVAAGVVAGRALGIPERRALRAARRRAELYEKITKDLIKVLDRHLSAEEREDIETRLGQLEPDAEDPA